MDFENIENELVMLEDQVKQGMITLDEYKELLEDIQNTLEVHEAAEAMELKAKVILAISVASNLV